MKNLVKISFAILATFFLASCESYKQEEGNGNITSQDRPVEEFKEVEVKGNFEVFLKKSSTPSLTITADDNLQEFITVNQKGDVLEISTDRTLRSKEGIKLYVEFVNLTAIGSSGAAVIKSEDVITGDYLRLDMSGAGAIDLEVDLKALKINISGAGAIELAGNVLEQNIQMSGAGGLDAYDLVSQKCKIDISGVGGAGVTVKKKLEATVSGVGGINYRGNPEEVNSNVTGLGTIVKDEEAEDENI